MLAIKADVTAEKKPAYIPPRFIKKSRDIQRDAHKNQGAAQVFVIFLDEIAVAIVGCALKFVVELDGGVAGRPEEVRKEGWERFQYSILQAENDRKYDD